MDSYLYFLQTFHSFWLQLMLTDGLEWCGLLVDYCDVFISSLDSHSDGTHSLQRIHWWTSDVKLNFSKSFLMKKQTSLGCHEGECISAKFHFWVNCSFCSPRKSKCYDLINASLYSEMHQLQFITVKYERWTIVNINKNFYGFNAMLMAQQKNLNWINCWNI